MIYHAGLTTEALLAYRNLYPAIKLNAMLSYGRRQKANYKLLFEYKEHLNSLAADSGTWTRNCNPQKYAKQINFKGFQSYLKIFAPRLDFYVNYDEDFSKNGFETNLEYQLQLEAAGFSPVPVIHDCYGKEVKYYIEHGYKFVAIGSGELAYSGIDELHYIVDELYQNGIKVHFLGCTNFEKLAYLPVYSCDSSTWGQAGRRDYLLYWNSHVSRIDKKDKIPLNSKLWKYPFLREFEEYLDLELGLELNDLIGRDKTLNRHIVNIHYFTKVEDLIHKKHKELGYTFE